MAYTFDTLATFRTICEYEGIQHQPCRFMTSLCPDRCGHAKDLAVFKVVKVVEYTKPGQYGDDENTERFHLDTNPNTVVEEQDNAILGQIKDLVPGKQYYVDWDHIYVDKEGSKFPVRPCKRIAPVE